MSTCAALLPLSFASWSATYFVLLLLVTACKYWSALLGRASTSSKNLSHAACVQNVRNAK